METKHKEFKPFDKVLVRGCNYAPWNVDFYSYYNNEAKRHETVCHYCSNEEYILPFEGNEHLVGQVAEPDEEEVKLEIGELIIATNHRNRIDKCLGTLEIFKGVKIANFEVEDYDSYNYAIRLSDFNPNDMEETKKHILCVKNGKVVKYKG